MRLFASEAVFRLHPEDDVAVARREVACGALAGKVTAHQPVPPGHKIAVRPIAAGSPVRKYGQVIGFALADIAPGDWVHTHNLGFGPGRLQLDYAIGTELRRPEPVDEVATFQGYARSDGRVGTRNYLAVIATVNCSASVVTGISRRLEGIEREHDRFDGVIPLVHRGGCGGKPGWELELLRRTLAGFAKHPNVGAYVLVGLGCEGNQLAEFIESGGLIRLESEPGKRPPAILMQEVSGTEAAIAAGVKAVLDLVPGVAAARRTTQPASKLTVALQCGGSDAFSGITANPALGAAADLLVRHGGTAVLGETPEIYGAEHLLTRRAASPEVAEKLLARLRWWQAHVEQHGFTIDNNPAPGNKAGGLTTIFEKSLGAVAKGGTLPLTAVYDYAEPITAPGFCHMDTPGYDPVSVTGQVAGGCNLVVFTTGRGSCFGFKPAPVLKVATNTAVYDRMNPDLDLNAGTIFDGAETVPEVGRRIFERLLTLAGGEPSKSEALGLGTEEFNPWILGCTM